jgi:aspartate-semialdehyde dehydrogenase
MSLERESTRIVIAGASSLLGVELKSLLEHGRFAIADFRLFDEELTAASLTEAGGEVVVIQPVEEDSFKRARFVFFTGSAAFTNANLDLAKRSGALIIDLSGHSASVAEAVPWFRGFDSLHGQLSASDTQSKLVSIPSAAAEAIVRMAFGLGDLRLRALSATVLQSVSAWGKDAIEELEQQTSHLLSFQPAGMQLFDAQIAFNTMVQFGEKSRFDLRAAAATLRAEVSSCLRGSVVVPAIQVLHVPAFYGTTFSVCAELDPTADVDTIDAAVKAAGFSAKAADDPPNNVNSVEETSIGLAQPARDEAVPGIWWFWGAADNIRLRACNAVKLAETLAEKLAE